MAKNNLDVAQLVNKVKKATIETPVQKVVPVSNSISASEKAYNLRLPEEMLLFLKNKASFEHGLTIKELIFNALINTYGEEFKNYNKNVTNK